jgi:predicted small metal-binding protein
MVSGHDKKEVIAVVIEHAKTHHNMNLTEKDVEGMVKTTEASK